MGAQWPDPHSRDTRGAECRWAPLGVNWRQFASIRVNRVNSRQFASIWSLARFREASICVKFCKLRRQVAISNAFDARPDEFRASGEPATEDPPPVSVQGVASSEENLYGAAPPLSSWRLQVTAASDYDPPPPPCTKFAKDLHRNPCPRGFFDVQRPGFY